MRGPRPWLLSEVATAARPILALERAAARERLKLGGRGKKACEFRRPLSATEATALRWVKSRDWLEWLLKVDDAAGADPVRIGPALNFLDAGGAPNVAWSCISTARDSETAIALPTLKRQGRRLLTDAWKGRWSLVDINLAVRALLEARIGHAPVIGGAFNAEERRALTDLGKLWNESPDFLLRTLEVCEAAALDPDRFGFLVPVMCKADNPTAAWKRMNGVSDEQRCLDLVPYDGSVQTVVADPPWMEVNVSAAAGHAYAKMSLDQIRAMPLQTWAWENAHLYLWFINGVWGEIPSIVQAWGFEVKTVHTWVKETSDLSRNDPKFSLGHEMRNTTEFFVFARRGSKKKMPRRGATYSTATHHRWPLGANSEKPDAFYDFVKRCSYGPYGEAFQRKPREDFLNLYRSGAPEILVAAE